MGWARVGKHLDTCLGARRALVRALFVNKGADMGIDKESDLTANIQIGPTSLGMVRIYVEGDGVEVPMDFEPEEADEIADEIKAAAAAARAMAVKRPKGPKGR